MNCLSRAVVTMLVLLGTVLSATAGVSAVPDHLECYRVRDPQRGLYTADLGGLAPEPGCVIRVPAVLVCVPTTKTNVRPTPPGTGSGPATGVFGCYKVRCRRTALPTLRLNDQFGDRQVAPRAARIVCAPNLPIPTTTTTTIPQVCSQPGACPGGCLPTEGCANVRMGCACAPSPACGLTGGTCGGNCPAGTSEPCHLDTFNGQCMCGSISPPPT